MDWYCSSPTKKREKGREREHRQDRVGIETSHLDVQDKYPTTTNEHTHTRTVHARAHTTVAISPLALSHTINKERDRTE